jgi:hypothetical protein
LPSYKYIHTKKKGIQRIYLLFPRVFAQQMSLFIGVPLMQCLMWLVWRAGKRLTGLCRFYAVAAAAEPTADEGGA